MTVMNNVGVRTQVEYLNRTILPSPESGHGQHPSARCVCALSPWPAHTDGQGLCTGGAGAQGVGAEALGLKKEKERSQH